MQIFENEQNMSHDVACHQMAENNRINTANIENQKHNSMLFLLGLISGVFIGVGILGVAIYSLYMGYPWVATAAFSTLAAILVILVLRKMPATADSGKSPSKT